MARTIRTCSAAALAVSLLALPAAARENGDAALSHYVTARILDARDAGSAASQAYALALAGAPGNERVATRAFRQALEAGNMALATKAAHALATQNQMPQDARLLLFGECLSKGDWRGARLWLDRIEEAGGFDFLLPSLRAWTTFAARDGDPLGEAEKPSRDGLGSIYLQEQKALLLLAMKRIDEGVIAAKAQARTDNRGRVLKLAVAARLVALRQRDKALEILAGEDQTLASARARVEAGESLPGAIDTPGEGSGFLIGRVAGDLMRDSGSSAALLLARIADFSAPSNDAIRLVLAQALVNNGRADDALAILDTVNPLFEPAVHQLRIATLQRANRSEEALVMAKAAAALPSASIFEYVRLGDVLTRMKRHAEAAAAYREAINRAKGDVPWNILLLYGAALDQQGDWKAAKPVLESAVTAAPDQPTALNHLGYAMLEHGDDLAAATRLIAKASELRPDDAAITDSLGWAFYLRGLPDQSIPLLERAVAAEPTEATVGEHLGDAYWAAGRHVDARYAWRAALVQAEEDDAARRIAGKIADGLPARTR